MNGDSSINSQKNVLTNQQPTYLLHYGMVDKDSDTYDCYAISNADKTNPEVPINYQLNLDINSEEAGMHPIRPSDGSGLIIRSNTLGGDDIISASYNIKELYRITLTNSITDFPYGETKFRGLQPIESCNATYPSEFYFLMGEGDLNTFFVRKGQTQRSVVMDYDSVLVATDGHSFDKNLSVIEDIDTPAIITPITGGTRDYSLHIFYIYDRYYIELDNKGNVTSNFDANFY